MRYTHKRALLLIMLVSVLSEAGRAQNATTAIGVTGFITDTLSGRTGATATHIQATKANVGSGMGKYAVYDETTKQLYILEPQSTAAAYLEFGQPIVVTGTLATSPLKNSGQSLDPATGALLDHHSLRARSSTPIAGVLTITSIDIAPPPNPKAPTP